MLLVARGRAGANRRPGPSGWRSILQNGRYSIIRGPSESVTNCQGWSRQHTSGNVTLTATAVSLLAGRRHGGACVCFAALGVARPGPVNIAWPPAGPGRWWLLGSSRDEDVNASRRLTSRGVRGKPRPRPPRPRPSTAPYPSPGHRRLDRKRIQVRHLDLAISSPASA